MPGNYTDEEVKQIETATGTHIHFKPQSYRSFPMPDKDAGTIDLNIYPVAPEMLERLENDFTYHAPKPAQPERYTFLLYTARELAELIVAMSPKSREQSLALTKLEEAVFWVNAAISRNE